MAEAGTASIVLNKKLEIFNRCYSFRVGFLGFNSLWWVVTGLWKDQSVLKHSNSLLWPITMEATQSRRVWCYSKWQAYFVMVVHLFLDMCIGVSTEKENVYPSICNQPWCCFIAVWHGIVPARSSAFINSVLLLFYRSTVIRRCCISCVNMFPCRAWH